MPINRISNETSNVVRRVTLTTNPFISPTSTQYMVTGLDSRGLKWEIVLDALPPGVTVESVQAGQQWFIERRTGYNRLFLYIGELNLKTNTKPGYYANYYSTVTQTALLANTPYATTYNVTSDANGFSVDSTGSQITAQYAGTYQFVFTAQVINYNSSGSATNNLSFWSRMNGIDVPWSAGEYTAFSKGGGVTPGLVVGWNFITEMNAGDYVQLMWGVDNSSNYLQLVAQPSPPYGPAVPSVTITAQQL